MTCVYALLPFACVLAAGAFYMWSTAYGRRAAHRRRSS